MNKTLIHTALCSLPVFILACTGDEGRPADEDNSGIGLMDSTDSADDEAGDDEEDSLDDGGLDEGPLLDFGNMDPDDTEEEECASVDAAAEAKKLPADIIIVVDNSGSMGDEAAAVQANLNSFSQLIIDSGVDVHVALLSSYPDNGYGICVDPPLGGGTCPNSDDNLPLFNHVDLSIGSSNALQRLVNSYDEWGPYIREDAVTHVLIVTDDESNMSASAFMNSFTSLAPGLDDVRVHGVVSMQNCADAADIGDTYIDLAEMTGGVVADLCDQDFVPVFQALSEEVIGGSLLPCEFEIPAPPEGENFDPDKVNVEFDDGQGNVVTLTRVESAEECAQVDAGWYYDDPEAPTTIIMCEQTCTTFQGLEQASVEILFGCETILPE
ncbi:VWA domain-containing protein [Pseudenhygromyxa sp. WMMC2535]|uniref:VWA domain-containing protein n=1 Tax=Pseudenhygromyxa sp. WMMC2535 TaxID=2712867 RepID=UPI001553A5D3|nr:VWA domain-containing protein [Pseudenhygromyxa sp. WMMC2535]NVB37300.1 VWA domain-containing protein [Pseudenhygromyxa sp. WMMC2535]